MSSASIEEFNNPSEDKIDGPSGSPKKRKKRAGYIIGIMLVIVLITGIAGLGFAKGFYDKYRGEGPWGFMMDKIVKDLNLTDQQKTEVEKIRGEIKTKMESNREERKQHADEMEQMFRSDTFDKNKALEFAGKRDAKRDEMRSFMIDKMAQFHSILTPDQRNKAADKMKEFREKKREHRNKNKNRENK